MNFTEEFQDFEAEFGTEVGKDGLMVCFYGKLINNLVMLNTFVLY